MSDHIRHRAILLRKSFWPTHKPGLTRYPQLLQGCYHGHHKVIPHSLDGKEVCVRDVLDEYKVLTIQDRWTKLQTQSAAIAEA